MGEDPGANRLGVDGRPAAASLSGRRRLPRLDAGVLSRGSGLRRGGAPLPLGVLELEVGGAERLLLRDRMLGRDRAEAGIAVAVAVGVGEDDVAAEFLVP